MATKRQLDQKRQEHQAENKPLMDHAHEDLAMILERAPERFNEPLDRSAETIGSDIVNYVP